MPSTVPFLEFEIVWNDEDLQEVVVSASSGVFTGQVNLYAGWNELESIAESFRDFPRSRTDRRKIQLGQEELSGYGTAALTIYCTDSLGHVELEIAMRTNPSDSARGKESAVVVIPTVVGDLDRFAAELRRINNQVGCHAVLRGSA
jgi:hypothetical protein